MSIFLLIFFLIYAIFHGYAYLKMRAVIPITGWGHVPACLFILMMVTMPVLTRLLENSGLESAARITAYFGYGWMGFLFFFVSAALLMDMVGLAYVAGQWLLRVAVRRPFSKQTAFWLPTTLALIACAYGFFEAAHIKTETVTLFTDKLPPGRERLRIVQISDLHLGVTVRQNVVRQVVAKINQANPDLLVSTGDLVDGKLAGINGLAEIFQQLTPPLGKFAVTGNHEFYVGINHSREFTRKAGFDLLQDEYVQIDNWLTIVGLDDLMARRMGVSDSDNGDMRIPVATLSKTFVLLLRHRPVIIPEAAEYVNLQLSGHTHNGQIFPFNLLVHLFYPVSTGISQPAEGYSLYVNRGTGTWGPPFRLFAPPEITVIDLVKEK